MKIIHVTSLNYKLSNGIKSVLQALVPEQQKLGNEVLVVNLTINDCKLFSDECFIRSISEFRLLIRDKEPDIVIFHGNYNPKYYQFSWFLKSVKIPYLIVPHGGTSLQNLKKNKLIKVIVNKLFTNRFVSKSKGLLFLNRQEHESSIYFGKAYYHIIPNGVHVNQFKPENKKRDSIVHFFYLSRIDFQHKGLDLLLQGIELFTQSNPGLLCDFSFYGGRFDPVFVDKFKDMISNMHTPVKYYGEVLGKEKE